jgi:hypothetical protein
MADTFTCDNCGKEFPADQMKEVKTEGTDEVKKLDPSCLDEVMNKATDVYGVEGEKKNKAAFVSDGSGSPDEPVTGKRE